MKTKINEAIKQVLQQFGEKYFIEEVLNKNKVIRDLDTYDKGLLEAFISNETLKSNFTIDIAGNIVMQTNKLIELFEADEYWQDSYTKYSKKIGLTAGGKFIDESTDVVLDFPYKDTVLKASMSKEDTDKDDLRPDEPFLNEVIAKEEIDVLLDKKILVNAKKYDDNGEHEVDSFSEDDNLIMKGNNLLALHTLKEKYAGKVKMIYIDPPYLFKETKEEDTFNYNSNFHMSTWLTFMRNRLIISKELLIEGGTIWININEDGMHYLKVLADSIFGIDKFLGTTPRRTRYGKSDVPFNYSQDFDFLLAYSNVEEKNQVIGRKVERNYYTSEDYPGRPWRLTDLTTQRNYKERPNSYFTMVDPKTQKEYPASQKRTWAVTKDTFQHYYDNGYIVFPDDYPFLNITKPYMRKFEDEDMASGKLSSVISDFLLQDFLKELLTNCTNKLGNDEVNQLLENESFSYPKPENLLKNIIDISTKENDIVLDFFMGSATTQAVAHKMNRRYIGIEQMDYINTVSVPRLQKVIEGEQGGISKDVDWQGGGSFVYVELMEKNRGFLKSIRDARTQTELHEVFDFMVKEAEIDFRVDLEKIKDTLHELSFDDQKKTLIKIIDKNQLYFNYSEIDDENVRDLISNSDYSFNKNFYDEGGE
ncbi:MAG: site-specific DNA-methyltransferase [Bacillus sp. (in: Bacteria)]|uniref:DNA methylase N-4/N-6 domain-containing protein n=2 Tax=Bacillus sonorensis TaxID=119858 RepID=M5P7N5_9BACI|nr:MULTISPECIES: site-specific DNA-methyltransferase [Bacillus]ASB90215.1 Site-specific DNA-methyltransferase (adenine-specific) [Bacillus sonorensis]EME76011.1 DNA methylase N-4/N-6 domain-containing protein [Bacillus sonorensis L12]MBG9916591.1 type III restriction-modification system methylation subunit [Bacillus sonorensis]MBW4886304.1 site-specific DNA-methyltransferase [Bacillus sp. (in: firmicutes)]MBX9434848.1 site-specific DNA-methyltransferase [Bacillus paralicheniformis]